MYKFLCSLSVEDCTWVGPLNLILRLAQNCVRPAMNLAACSSGPDTRARLSRKGRVPLRAIVVTRIARSFPATVSTAVMQRTNTCPWWVGLSVCPVTALPNYAWHASNWTERCLVGQSSKPSGCCENLELCRACYSGEWLLKVYLIRRLFNGPVGIERSDKERRINCGKSRWSLI